MKLHVTMALYFIVILFSGISSSANPVVQVQDAWIREAPPNASTLAGYMVIINPSNKDQSLVSASTTAFAMAMIHRTEHQEDMVQMKHQKQVIIPAKGKVVFAPGSYHLMLMNPRQALHAGDRVTINLAFGDGSKLDVVFKVQKGMPMKNNNHALH